MIKYECHHCVFESWSTAYAELYFWRRLPGLVTVSLPVLLSANHVLSLEYMYDYYPKVEYEVVPAGGVYGHGVRPLILVKNGPSDFVIPEFWFSCYSGGDSDGSEVGCDEAFEMTGELKVVPHSGLQSEVVKVQYDIEYGRTGMSISSVIILMCSLIIPSIGYLTEKTISQFYFAF